MTIDMNDLQDITYDVDDGLAWIVTNRPDRYNAFRGRTIDELIRNAETEHTAGVEAMAFDTLELFVETEEAAEGMAAFNEKRSPDFQQFR